MPEAISKSNLTEKKKRAEGACRSENTWWNLVTVARSWGSGQKKPQNNKVFQFRKVIVKVQNKAEET